MQRICEILAPHPCTGNLQELLEKDTKRESGKENKMTRAEHLAWAKQRALEYVDMGDISGALASMMSDLGKHPELANHAAIELTGMLMVAGLL